MGTYTGGKKMKAELTEQKLRGGYYTPKPITDFITKWGINSKDLKVLEPSCGDGNFLESVVERFQELEVTNTVISRNLNGIEFDAKEAEKSIIRLNSLGISNENGTVINGDFFSYCNKFLSEERKFDVVMGNPPFIRYQNFMEEHRVLAFEIMKTAGLKPNRLTNSWVPFLIASSMLLNDNGKLGMIIPAELFQVSYAAQTREFLSNYFSKITIVTFKKLVFPDIQQEVILLLCEKNGSDKSGIKVVELDGIDDLSNYDVSDLSLLELKPIDHSSEKWTKYYLTTEEILTLRKLREHPNITKSGDVIDVDVGIVTGLNEFFVLNENKVKDKNLSSFTQKIVTRSAHLEGAIFNEEDWNKNVMNQYPTALFSPPSLPFEEQPMETKEYISLGEQEGVNKGYKCRIRKNWYIVPSVWIPDAFMLRQVHKYPKIIVNKANATCTDTVHRVRFLGDYNGKQVAAAFTNSLTFAFSEVTGRSYGGGVLTFEPSEAENLPLPLMGSENLDLDLIDELIRKNDIDAVLDITDKVLLVDGLGLSSDEVLKLRNMWEKLRDRRINRKKKSKNNS